MDTLVIPYEISQNALFTIIPCVLIGMYIAIASGYVLLIICYVLLFITSVLYWTNTNWSKIMYIDMSLAFIILCVKSYIVVKHFTPFFVYLWAITLFVMGVSFMVNREILIRRMYPQHELNNSIMGDLINKYYSVTYTNPNTSARLSAFKKSVQLHMITIHLTATFVFVSGLYVSHYHYAQ
jgi:hypothetical protein